MDQYKTIRNNSIAIGIMLSSGFLSSVLSIVPNGIVLAIFIPLLFILRKTFISGITKSSHNCLSVLVVFFLFFWIYSIVISGFKNLVIGNLIQFIVLGVPFIIVANYEFDSLIVLKVVVLASIIGLPSQTSNINMIDVTYNADGELLMVISYNIIKIVVSSILLFFLDKKFWIKGISFLIFLPSFIFLMSFGARGAQISLIATFLFLFIYSNNKRFRLFSFKNMLIIIVCFLMLTYFAEIVVYLKKLLIDYDISSITIDRLLFALENDKDLSSGRFDIYLIAIQEFLNKPLLGNGIGAFENYSGAHPHNFVLQLLHEGGLFLGLPIIFVIAYTFFMLNSKMCKQNRFFLIFLICSGLLHLLFSSIYWTSSYFWFLFGIAIKDINRKVKLGFS